MEKVFTAINTILLAAAAVSLFISSHFWMGTKEAWEEAVKNLVVFCLARFAVNLIVSAIFLVVVSLLFFVLRRFDRDGSLKGKLVRFLLWDLVVLSLVSVIFITISILG